MRVCGCGGICFMPDARAAGAASGVPGLRVACGALCCCVGCGGVCVVQDVGAAWGVLDCFCAGAVVQICLVAMCRLRRAVVVAICVTAKAVRIVTEKPRWQVEVKLKIAKISKMGSRTLMPK